MFAFMDVFNGLRVVFPKRLDDHEARQMGRAYFKTLRAFPLSQVSAGADTWMQKGKFFPKPAEWLEAIPRRSATPTRVLGSLTALEIADYADAEARHYDGDPCRCPDCRAAGVDHRFLRFVPDVDPDGRDARGLIGERVVIRGHWAHGQKLARWYAAREQFWADMHTQGLMTRTEQAATKELPFTERIARIFTRRAAGQGRR